jgi:glutamine amidotransferase
MHNGAIAEFPLIKRNLQATLPDKIFNVVQGNTGVKCLGKSSSRSTEIIDSEWAFALFLSKVTRDSLTRKFLTIRVYQLPDPDARTFSPEVLKQAMLNTISSFNSFADNANIEEVFSLSLHAIISV